MRGQISSSCNGGLPCKQRHYQFFTNALERFDREVLPPCHFSHVASTLISCIFSAYFARFSSLQAGQGIGALQAERMASPDLNPNVFSTDEVAEACQFLSTVLILQGKDTVGEEVRTALIGRLAHWKRHFGSGFVIETIERC